MDHKMSIYCFIDYVYETWKIVIQILNWFLYYSNLQRTGFCLLGCWAINIARYETTYKKTQIF